MLYKEGGTKLVEFFKRTFLLFHCSDFIGNAIKLQKNSVARLAILENNGETFHLKLLLWINLHIYSKFKGSVCLLFNMILLHKTSKVCCIGYKGNLFRFCRALVFS